MRKIRLYIGDKLVDLPKGVSLPITYTTEDFKNPTLVKNSFSKTISLPNTEANNEIFTHFYRIDRAQLSGAFNPSQRIDFKLYCNNDLVDQGYVQLNSISGIGPDKQYNITLYGGLGDFFYGLKYNEDGTIRTLADLNYFTRDENGNYVDEFSFRINQDFVSEAFNKNNWDGEDILDLITFIPANNGMYEDFDNSHCIVQSGAIFPHSLTNDGRTYTTVNGFALANLSKDYTEWEMRDLRSYKQRPAIKLSKLIETICREENSGYKVNFDPSFFNDSNPYWDKTFIALPLLKTESEGENTTKTSKLTTNDSIHIGKYASSYIRNDDTTIIPTTYYEVSNGFIDLSGIPDTTSLSISIPLQIKLHPENTNWNEIFPAAYYGTPAGHNEGTSFTAQILLEDENGNYVGFSNLYNFTSDPAINSSYAVPNPTNWDSYLPIVDGASTSTILGSYKKVGNEYYFQSRGNDTTTISLSNWTKNVDKVKIKVAFTCQSTLLDLETPGISYLYDNNYYQAGQISDIPTSYSTYAWYEPIIGSESVITTTLWDDIIVSNYLVTQRFLLKTEQSPADYLLSFTKLFGLYFIKDIYKKEITIYNRNNFFTGEYEDWTDKIDYSKDMTISPLLFDKKWYLMSLDTPETFFAKKYTNEYGLTYGQQRLNTGYNFNSEVTELYSDNVYQNIITATDSDKYFRNFYDYMHFTAPPFVNDNITYTLYDGVDSYETDIYGSGSINPNFTTEWTSIPGADIFAKPCFFTLDADQKSLEDISSSILFYNGPKELRTDTDDYIWYWLTDDVPEMAQLNDKTPCFLYTFTENVGGKKVATFLYNLPQYSSYLTDSENNVLASLDFGLPREAYIDDLQYSADTTIYANFWRSFYTDQFNINTKKLTCYVKLDRVDQDMLRKFYYFDNSIWILNKIDNFDITSYDTTRCEFIKVQEPTNYTEGMRDYSTYFRVTPNRFNYLGGNITMTVNASHPWRTVSTGGLTLSTSSGDSGITTVSGTMSPNTSTGMKTYQWTVEFPDLGTTSTAYIIQEPGIVDTVRIYGTVDINYNNPTVRVYVIDKNEIYNAYQANNEYEVFIDRNMRFRIDIYSGVDKVGEHYSPGVSADTRIDMIYTGSTYLTPSYTEKEVPWDTLYTPIAITSNRKWFLVDGSDAVTLLSTTGYVGITNTEVEFTEGRNTGTDARIHTLVLETDDGRASATIHLYQLAKDMITLTLNIEGNLSEIICHNSNFSNSWYYADNGQYKIQVRPNEEFTLDIYDADSIIYTERLTIANNTTKNINLINNAGN